MCTAIISALMGVCFFAGVVAILSIPWMIGTESK